MSGTKRDVIRLRGLVRSFGDKRVLRGIDMDVRDGETLVVLGRSGSGKSVILKHIIGLLKPDAGSIEVDGEDITGYDEHDLGPVRRKVAMLFQGGALFDSMNVHDNVAFSLREHTDLDEADIASVVREKLAMVDLENVEHLMPASLSGGMKKRVALARAIALEPSAVLYDEPTTGLDPIVSAKINRLIRQLQDRLGITSVVVTHDIDSAMRVGDRIALLHEGRVEIAVTVDEARRVDSGHLKDFLEGRGE